MGGYLTDAGEVNLLIVGCADLVISAYQVPCIKEWAMPSFGVRI